MNKYITKNCPCYEYGFCTSPRIKEQGCKNCTDCLIKQVIEKCRGVQEKFYDAVHSRYLSPSKAKFAREILQLFDIEEAE